MGMFAAIYSVVANLDYIRVSLKGRLRSAGPSVAHFGFGLMLVGILFSSAKKEVLSYNTTGITLNFDAESKQDPMENITLLKGVRTDMGKYWTTFVADDSLDTRQRITYYKIHFEKKDGTRQFDLYPNWMKPTKGAQTPAANPDKYHYWDRDIFTYISATDNPEQRRDDTVQFRNYALGLHDTAFYSKGYVILDRVVVNPDSGRYHFGAHDTALMAQVTVVGRDSIRYTARPLLSLKENIPYYFNDTVFAQNLALRFSRVTDNGKIELGLKESAAMIPFVALKVYEFPQINILWIGTIIMVIGFIMSMLWRRRQVLTAK
jgi:cytochrome c-type biogenesis protein CcmF